MQAAIQRWLGDLIELHTLHVASEDATLRIDVQYMVRRTNQTHTTSFARAV